MVSGLLYIYYIQEVDTPKEMQPSDIFAGSTFSELRFFPTVRLENTLSLPFWIHLTFLHN